MAKKKKYVKLGPKAFGFADAFSRFNIYKGQVKELETVNQRRSQKIKRALLGGHLQAATEEEFEEYKESLVMDKPKKEKETPAEPTLQETLSEKTKAELTEYYKDNYQVSESEITSFEKLKHDDMVEELLELAEED